MTKDRRTDHLLIFFVNGPINCKYFFYKLLSSWYPPGHGDFYQSFYNSGLMKELLDKGRKIVFLSNIDNLGATVDLSILNFCIETQAEFIMEVTDKTRADVKGGTLIQYQVKRHVFS